ncbi:MAG: 50S ribosomal protein L3 [Candidatus Liptonbacteria bacterium]|nr:50S ribosomal protein L3 [Candidatus Liptonbacteria bacterium]
MFILGRKFKMAQIWKDKKVIPVTVIQAEPNTVSLTRTTAKDGYEAVQLELRGMKKEFKIPAGFSFYGEPGRTVKKGDAVTVEAFGEGDVVRVSGITKGRGFQGVVKRHGFSGGPKTHGQKNRHRMPGSIGNTTPQRVIPGRRMAGHMGVDRVTVKSLVVVGVDKEKNLLLIRGAVPGARGGLLEISKL